jgi:hypothetical protein
MKIRHDVSTCLVALTLLITSVGLWVPIKADASPANVAYFAVYCPQGGGLSTKYAADNVLTCHKGGAPPLFEAGVNSLTSNPNGAHFVTIIQADCYPDTSQVPTAPATPTGHINCGGSPDATLTLGSTFPAAGTPSPGPSNGLSPISSGDLPQTPADAASIQNVLGIAFGVIGAFALLMITVSGLRYVLSAGDPEKIARAKNGIIYSLVGIGVAVSAEAIVLFVAGNL